MPDSDLEIHIGAGVCLVPGRDIFRRAKALGMLLLDGLEQQSFSIVATDGTTWFSRRAEDVG